ncbi:PQQ-binding-like beta-propeller repeat protein [Catenulispora yoronensis]
MSAGVDAGVGIVATQGTAQTRVNAASECAVISAIDIASGKVLWTTPASMSFGDPDAGAADYAAAGGMAIIDSDRATAGTGIVALDLKTGEQKWKHPGDCEHRPHAFAVSGTKVAIAEVCSGQPQATVKVLDAATGAEVPNAAVPAGAAMAGVSHPEIVSADPVVAVDDGTTPKALSFGGVATPVAVSGLDGLMAALTANAATRAQVGVGAGVLCAGGHQAACWGADGKAVAPRGLPNAAAEHHDVYAVVGNADVARVVTTGVPGHPRASLCRVAGDGGVVVEADLSQAVSDYLGKSGNPGSYSVYGDAKDLFLLDPHPNGRAAVIDVRLG